MDLKPVIVLGAGGHAKVVIDTLQQSGREITGLTDPNIIKGNKYFDVNVLGDDGIIQEYMSDEVELANGLGTIPGSDLRWRIASRMRSLGYKFTIVIHPSAVIANSAYLEEGVQIMAGCILQPDVVVGRDTIINTGVSIDHDCQIGANCHIAPGVSLSGGVRIGDFVHIGTGATAIQNISIGSNSVVAAGSVIYRDIASGVTLIQSKIDTLK